VEDAIPRETLVELVRPVALEVDRVDQKHDRERIDGRRHDVRDLALGLIGDPRVDGLGRRRVTEVQCRDLGVVVLSVHVEELGDDGGALPVPHRVCQDELHPRVQAPQQVDHGAIGIVDLLDRHPLELEGLPHSLAGLAGGTVVGHAQCHPDAQRRDEEVLLFGLLLGDLA
jgi:hypothetical protein